jgi:hypothetical protein
MSDEEAKPSVIFTLIITDSNDYLPEEALPKIDLYLQTLGEYCFGCFLGLIGSVNSAVEFFRKQSAIGIFRGRLRKIFHLHRDIFSFNYFPLSQRPAGF